MIEELQNAIISRNVLLIRMDGTPEGSYITIEPHLILHNILLGTTRLLMFVIKHWAEGGHTGWTNILLDSIIEIQSTDQVFTDRNPKPVDWQLHNQIFPSVQQNN